MERNRWSYPYAVLMSTGVCLKTSYSIPKSTLHGRTGLSGIMIGVRDIRDIRIR